MRRFYSILVVILLTLFLGGQLFSCQNKLTSKKSSSDLKKTAKTRNHEGETVTDKWSLWQKGPHLRGANIFQRRTYPSLDGSDYNGPGPVGPPYTQQDINRLAKLGANVVTISHPGLFAEVPPYKVDKHIQRNLDKLLLMIKRSDMFAVIAFRTGPGRNEFTIQPEEADRWYPRRMLINSLWESKKDQDEWVSMWRYTAKRYLSNPIVVGYELMVEPNSNELPLEIYEPAQFYERYQGTLFDWNQLYPQIVAAVREVDSDTPILVGGMGYSAIEWLPYLKPAPVEKIIYTVHQYAPDAYTHQVPKSPGGLKHTYPGEFDTDGNGSTDKFDRVWLENLLTPIEKFRISNNARLAVTEFGVMRWQPGAASFMADQMELFAEEGLNYTLWVWEPSWEPIAGDDTFNFRHGPDHANNTDVSSSDLLKVIREHWKRNIFRPSKVKI